MENDQVIIFDNYILKNTHGYHIIESIGYDPRRTDYREVFVAITKNKEKFIMKIGRLNPIIEKNNKTIEEEIDLLCKMSDLNISPKVVDIWKDTVYDSMNENSIGIACVVMEKWDTTYADYKPYIEILDNEMVSFEKKIDKETQERISNNLYNLIFDNKHGILWRFYNAANMVHGDAHTGNIVLKLDQDGIPIKAALIDFECSVSDKDHQSINALYPGWDKYLKYMYHSVQHFEYCRIHSTSICNINIPFVAWL